ncbi:MAG: hypothetical protein AVO34_01635 [Firmicutes bacterium ML8_F2]|jgi:4-amino-4-deoxy-L-arabinose transferase-like glycosyltransferase|nr:MAG: hypothetical protein AVO34_01635 [Firmicutes bacterium ML8_F2]
MKAKKKYFNRKIHIILLLLIIVIAAVFRLWQLQITPPGLYPDEAMNGNDAIETLATGEFKTFYPENNGREGLYIWLLSFSFKIFEPSPWSLRLVSAILGILTILGLYLLTKEIFYRTKTNSKNKINQIALLSSFFMAISFWHINFSRIGFRAILMVFLICFAFYFLLRAFRKNSALNYILAGLFFGLGFYSYLAFRLVVLLLGITILIQAVIYWQKRKKQKENFRKFLKIAFLNHGWWKIGLLFLSILIAVLPLIITFVNNPEYLISRTGNISIFAAEKPLQEFGVSIIKTAGMFHIYGDWNWRHNFAGSPLLHWTVGILFALGFMITFKNIFSRSIKEFFTIKRSTSIFLLSWFVIMLLPSILTREGMPHALRSIGIIPIVCIYTAIGLIWIFYWLLKSNKNFAILILLFFIIYPTFANYHKYFIKWSNNPNVSAAFRQDLVNLTCHLNHLSKDINKYVIVNEPGVPIPYPDGVPTPAQTIKFSAKDNINYLKENQINQIKTQDQAIIIVPLRKNPALDQQIKNKWSDLKIIKINEFDMYEIN